MTANINGFNLEVTNVDGLPRVRVSLANGTVVVDTDQVSIEGLGRLSGVFATAEMFASRCAVGGANAAATEIRRQHGR